MQQMGSYLSFLNFALGLALGAFQRHSLDKSMIKKLYSAQNKNVDDDSETSHKKVAAMFAKDKEVRLKSAVTERRVFSYPYWRGFYMKNFGSRLCCCCRARERRDDWLQQDAKQKLNEEIDILEIVKKLRVSKFSSEVHLKPRQRNLVGFFNEYMLTTPT